MLTVGTRLGPYEIVAAIGAGGMGEVYKAHDTRLGRDVAIKIAHEAFSDGFAREARAIAALSHTNVCHLYDVGPDYLVMEFVEGSTLRGPLSFDEALPIIHQLIDGIEAAHEKNIVHRDLKPANIKITPAGDVKILDFGLAKAMMPESFSIDVSNSPTIALPAGITAQGTIVGTSAYMAPEQAKGKQADKRADIWAFGVVVYELLVGRPLFQGETAIEILGEVLNKTPDLSVVPPRARRLLAWCLEKDRKDRLQAIGDARRLLAEESHDVAPPYVSSSWRGRLGWAIAAFALVGLVAMSWLYIRGAPLDQPLVHLSAPLPGNAPPGFLALSPDGRTLVMSQTGAGLLVRPLDSGGTRFLTGTVNARTPFWSPDSRTIAFFADGALKTVPASGGPPQQLCGEVGLGAGGTWNRDGAIVFATEAGALKRTAASGGACTDLIKREPGVQLARIPVFLPDGNHFLYSRGTGLNRRELFAASLADPTGHRLLPDQSSAEFVPDRPGSGTGHLLFVREETLMAQSFDATSLQLSGEPFAVAEQVSFTATPPQIATSASTNGTVVYMANGRPDKQLVWYDRSGKELTRVGGTGKGNAVSLAPDGRRVAFVRVDAQYLGETRLLDLERNQETRLFAPPLAPTVVWSPDAERMVFTSDMAGNAGIYVKNVNGGGEELLLRQAENRREPSDWSRDGRWIVYTENDPRTRGDIWLLPVASNTPRQAVALLRTPANESQGQISPDGRWLAYASDLSGSDRVYLRPFAGAADTASDTTWPVSTADNSKEPRWRADSKELYYLERVAGAQRFKLMAVPIGTATNPVGTPKTLFEFQATLTVSQYNAFAYSSSADGQRFLINVFATDAQPSLDVLLNWPSSLRK
jgi:eukaryotic-like serine/threonine-protein kinase